MTRASDHERHFLRSCLLQVLLPLPIILPEKLAMAQAVQRKQKRKLFPAEDSTPSLPSKRLNVSPWQVARMSTGGREPSRKQLSDGGGGGGSSDDDDDGGTSDNELGPRAGLSVHRMLRFPSFQTLRSEPSIGGALTRSR